MPFEFTFTPSMSVYIECEDLNEIELLYRKLKNGAIHTADDYNMSRRYAWIQDQLVFRAVKLNLDTKAIPLSSGMASFLFNLNKEIKR